MKKIIAISLMLLTAGCAYKAPSYTPSGQNAAELAGGDKKFSVVPQTATFDDAGAIVCRGGGMVSPPGEQSFTDYISTALKEELAASGRLSADGEPIKLQLTKVEFSTALGATNWYIDVAYAIGGERANVSTIYNDRSSYVGHQACTNIAQYLPKAVAVHLAQLYNSAAFVKALRPRAVPTASDGESLANRLHQLQQARKKGLLTEDEYQAKRKQVIGSF
jgi:hypothetical protein